MKLNVSILLFIFLFLPQLSAQDILEQYIQEGIANNLALKQKHFNLIQSIDQVKMAWGKLFPTITLSARTTWNGGGRVMQFPVGDLLNPVHEGLNTLMGAQNYPTDLGDQEFSLTPSDEQEIKLRVIQPIFIPSIYYNVTIQSLFKDAREIEVEIYMRFLKMEMKRAYFNYLKTVKLVLVYERMLEVMQENLRISETLLANGKATEDVVFRAQAEIASLLQKKQEAEKNKKLAAFYFNYLLQRPLDTPIVVIEFEDIEIEQQIIIQEAEACALSFREEINLLQIHISAQENMMHLYNSKNFPQVSAVFDFGYTGNEFDISQYDNFWSFSIIMEWEIFNGSQNSLKAKQALTQKQSLSVQLQETQEMIKLEVRKAYNELMVVQQSIISARQELSSMSKYFELISKKYEQGMASQIEYMDAQSRLTRAEINKLVTEYDYLIIYAQFESISYYDKRNNNIMTITED